VGNGNQIQHALWALVGVILLALIVLVQACTRSPTAMSCQELSMEPGGEAWLAYANSLCSHEELRLVVAFEPCSSSGKIGEDGARTVFRDLQLALQLPGAPGSGALNAKEGTGLAGPPLAAPGRLPLAYAFHQVVRFHPVDDFETDEDAVGEPFTAEQDLGRPVYVVDTGDHLSFAASVVDDKRPAGASGLTIGFEIEDAIKLPIDGADGDFDVLLASERHVLDALRTLGEKLKQDQVENAVVVLPFGAYNCGEAPTGLASALQTFPTSTDFVASAGNDEHDLPVFPAAFTAIGDSSLQDRVVSVGALADTGVRSCFSNYNSPDGVRWVDVWHRGEELPGAIGDERGRWSGTSFAAPEAAALIAAGRQGELASMDPPAPTPQPITIAMNPDHADGLTSVTVNSFCGNAGYAGPSS